MARYLNDLDVNSALDNADITLVEQSGVDKKVTLNDIKDFVLESVFPVGSIYTQLPSQSDPSALNYPGTWTNVSSIYAGDFMRIEGGNANAFEEGQQLDAMQRIIGEHTRMLFYGGSQSGAITLINDSVPTHSAQGGSGYNIRRLHFDSADSTSPNVAKTDDVETRPVNQTIRIWKRTA